MRILRVLISFVFCIGSYPAYAQPSCDDLALEFTAKISAQFVRKSPVMGNIFMSHPAAADFVILCGPGKVSVSVSKDGSPTADYLRLATVAGDLVTESHDKRLAKTIVECMKKARRSKDEMADAATEHVSIDCQSFVRDGGGNSITVGPKSAD